jgi:excisionase family DNA binding protein
MENPLSQAPTQEPLLRAREVAVILNISRAYAYLLMQRGELRTVVIGKTKRVRSQDLEGFIRANLTPAEE